MLSAEMYIQVFAHKHTLDTEFDKSVGDLAAVCLAHVARFFQKKFKQLNIYYCHFDGCDFQHVINRIQLNIIHRTCI